MDKDKFWQLLETEYGYQSPQRRRFLARYLPGWPTFIYYIRVIIVLARESLFGRMGKLTSERWAKASLEIIRTVESAGGRVFVSGLEGVNDYPGPLVYIANHMSVLEPLVIPCITLAFNDMTFVIKKELLNYPIIGWIMRALDFIVVSRQNPREDLKVVLNQGQNRISQGCSVVIFPQATRSNVFDVQSFNSLGVKLALKAGVPVVPLAVKTDFHGNGKLIKDIGPIDPRKTLYFKFGQPMVVEGKGRFAHEKVVEFIAQNLRSWGGEVKSNSEVGSHQ